MGRYSDWERDALPQPLHPQQSCHCPPRAPHPSRCTQPTWVSSWIFCWFYSFQGDRRLLDIFCCCRSIQAYTEQEIKHLRSSSCEESAGLSPCLTLIQGTGQQPFPPPHSSILWSCRRPKAQLGSGDRLWPARDSGCQQSLQGTDWENQSPSPAMVTCLQPLEEKNNNDRNLDKPTETEQGCARATLSLPKGLGSADGGDGLCWPLGLPAGFSSSEPGSAAFTESGTTLSPTVGSPACLVPFCPVCSLADPGFSESSCDLRWEISCYSGSAEGRQGETPPLRSWGCPCSHCTTLGPTPAASGVCALEREGGAAGESSSRALSQPLLYFKM